MSFALSLPRLNDIGSQIAFNPVSATIFSKTVILWPLDRFLGFRDLRLVIHLLKKQSLTREADFPEDYVPKYAILCFDACI